jgi:hypothetical protein
VRNIVQVGIPSDVSDATQSAVHTASVDRPDPAICRGSIFPQPNLPAKLFLLRLLPKNMIEGGHAWVHERPIAAQWVGLGLIPDSDLTAG